MSAAGLKVLVVGESWIKHTIHLKGFDQFHTTEYEEGGGAFLAAMDSAGADVTYVRAHEVSARFPATRGDLEEFDTVVLSDIGSNSFLLTDETFLRSERTTNRLAELAAYVEGGGGLVMVGGYMSFTGIDARARFGTTPLAPVLPVVMLDADDRVEVPEGIVPVVTDEGHGALGTTSGEWPALLGYNRLVAKGDSTVVATVGEDPLLVTGEHGEGRTVAFASDFAPHWAPPEFVSWDQYDELWGSIVSWCANRETANA